MRKLLVLLALLAAWPVWAKDKKPNKVPCDLRVEMLEAKVAVLQARLNSMAAFVDLLKTEKGLQYSFLETQGNEALKPFQAVLDKGSKACGDEYVMDGNSLECKKKEQSPLSKNEASDPAASAP